MVALYNGMGGGAAAAITAVELFGGRSRDPMLLVITVVGALIGSISLSGSLIAWGKLDGRIKKPWRIRGQQILNALVFLITVALELYAVIASSEHAAEFTAAFFVVALLFGVLMTMPIGGADMPVVISLYNAFTGLAVGLEGFVLRTRR